MGQEKTGFRRRWAACSYRKNITSAGKIDCQKPGSTLEYSVMIRKVYMHGQVSTILVFEDQSEETGFNPVFEALKEQAERIEYLEAQNRELVRQEELLAHLVEMTAQTGELMSRSLKALKRLEDNLQDVELPGDS